MAQMYGAVIPAAGRSQRMGEFKPLLPLGDSTIIGTEMGKLRETGVSRFALVLGREAERLRAAVSAPDVVFAVNAEYETTDMFHSVKLGLDAVRDSCDYLFFLPVDTPLFEVATLEKMKCTALETGCDVVIPAHRGRSGHPILLRGSAADAILGYSGDGGLSGALRNSGFRVERPECGDFGILPDADYRGDYGLLRLLYGEGVPEAVVRHEKAVARLVSGLANKLNAAGFGLDAELAELAALLHDCARTESRHDERGAEILRGIGRDDLAEIVRWHMLPEPDMRDKISEITLVYLADKLVKGDRAVTLEERFLDKLEEYSGSDAAKEIIDRYEIAKNVKAMYEKALGHELDLGHFINYGE